jgi:hypothetical protein
MLYAAILQEPFPAPFHILTFTPDLPDELLSPIEITGHILVQCVSNGVFFCALHSLLSLQAG